ncbi:MAG: hypothetical protein AAB974_02880 [Patescibacteria group bacterium]
MRTNDQAVYRHVVTDAWKLAWRRRSLWPFGFFAALVTTGGIVDVLIRGSGNIFDAEVSRLSGRVVPSLGELLRIAGPGTAANPPVWLIVAAVIGFIMVAALLWVAVVSQGALITGITVADRHASPKVVLGRGIAMFWPLFAIALVDRLLIGVVTFAAAVPFGAALAGGNPGTILLYVITYVAFVLISTAVFIIALYAAIDVTVSGSSLVNAVKNATHTFFKHWIVSYEAALVVFGIDVLVGLALLIGFVLLLVPTTLFLLMMQVIGTVAGSWLFLTLFGALLVAWVVGLASFATTLRYAIWTLLYERVQSGSVSAKIVRVLRAIPDVFREAAKHRA